MDDKVDKADKEIVKSQKVLEKYLRTKREGATISEMVVATGLATHWIEPNLRKVMQSYACQVEFNEKKELVYVFDFEHYLKENPFKTRLLDASQFILRILFFGLLLIWKFIGLAYLLVYIMSVLLFYFLNLPFVMFLYPIASLFFGSKKIDNTAEKLYDYSTESVGEVIDKVFGYELWDIPNFFDFKIRKIDRLAIEKQLLEYVSAYQGVILVTDIVKLTGWSLEKAEEEATQLIANYQGEIQLTEDGIIKYVFKDLEEKISTDIDDILWIWQKDLPLKTFDFYFYKRIWKGFAYAIILLAFPSFFFFVGFNQNLSFAIFFVLFPFYPYIFAILILSIKMLIIYLQNIPIHKKGKSYEILEQIISDIEGKDKIPMSFYYLPKIKDKFKQSVIVSLEPEYHINEKGVQYLHFPKLENEIQWRRNNKSKQREEKILFEDNFQDNKNEWSEGDNETRELKVEQSYYLFRHKRNERGWTTHMRIDEFEGNKDFLIEATLELDTGGKYDYFGLLWGRNDEGDGEYSFVINSNQKYMIDNTNGDNYIEWRKWTKTTTIKAYGKNTLKVKKYKRSIKFYINDILVFKTKFEKFYGQRVGFTIGKNISVKIHHLKITEFWDN